MNDNIKSKETEVYNNGLSRTCKYRDFSMYRVCYFGDKATGIIDCIGCHEDGRNAENGTDATKFAERGSE